MVIIAVLGISSKFERGTCHLSSFHKQVAKNLPCLNVMLNMIRNNALEIEFRHVTGITDLMRMHSDKLTCFDRC